MGIWSRLDPVILNKYPFDLTPPRFVEALVTPPPPHPPQLYTGAEQCVVTLDSFHLSFCLAALYHMIWVQINHSGISESCVWLLTCSSSAPFGLRFFLFKLYSDQKRSGLRSLGVHSEARTIRTWNMNFIFWFLFCVNPILYFLLVWLCI